MRTQGRMLVDRLPRRIWTLIAAVAALPPSASARRGKAGRNAGAHRCGLRVRHERLDGHRAQRSEGKSFRRDGNGHRAPAGRPVRRGERRRHPGYVEGTFTETLSEQQYAENKEKRGAHHRHGRPEKVLSTIGGLTIGYGGDGPEAYSRALWETDTNPTVGWRSGARHEIVLIADNVPHDVNLNEGLPESEWLQTRLTRSKNRAEHSDSEHGLDAGNRTSHPGRHQPARYRRQAARVGRVLRLLRRLARLLGILGGALRWTGA